MKNLFCSKSIKRLLSCLIALGMLVCVLPTMVYAEETTDDVKSIISANDYTSDETRDFQLMFYNFYGHNYGTFDKEFVVFFNASTDIKYDGAAHSIVWDEMNKYGLSGHTAESIAYKSGPSGDNLTKIQEAWKVAPVPGYYKKTDTKYHGIKRNVMMSARSASNPDYELNKYKYINFVLYSDKATNDTINVTLGNTVATTTTDGKTTTTHTKKFTSTDAITINWEGKWKTISVPVSNFEAKDNEGKDTGYNITDASENAANYFILTNTNPSADTTLYLHEVYMSVKDMSDPEVTETTYGVPSCSATAVTATVINKSAEPISCVLVAAVYSAVNGPLETVDFEEVTIQQGVEKGISVPLETAATTGKVVKGFLWDGLGTLVPLTTSTSYTVD